ncbi:hypothetical protein DFH06DRAFT_1224350 [Mycena polygramma]|nr:hypothetical protein DFH06DRAFT_1224350 [Mycena polygramma]
MARTWTPARCPPDAVKQLQTTSESSLSDFPPELLTRVFLQLPYHSLLSVEAVCVQWNALVTQDPELSVKMFRKRSTVYVEPGFPEPPYPETTGAAGSEPVRLHPAVQSPMYLGLRAIACAWQTEFVYYFDGDGPALATMAIANDFISIPVVTMVKMTGMLAFTVKNSKSVTLMDLFSAMEKEANRPVRGMFGESTKAQELGDFHHYEGLNNLVRSGLCLSAKMYMSG